MWMTGHRPVDSLVGEECPDGKHVSRGHSGAVKDLSEHLGLLEARFKGLAYEIASACALTQARVNDIRHESDEQWSSNDQLEKGREVLSRELMHINRELTGTVKAFEETGKQAPQPE